VTNNGLGVGMLVMGIGVDSAIVQKIPKPTFAKAALVAVKQISP
jgi:hypothetical protein